MSGANPGGPELAPFRAVRYDPGRVGELGAVWAPPYDVIDSREAAELRDRHPQNVVRLTLPGGPNEDGYAEAARRLAAWMEDGVLTREETPALYVHRHTFELDGATRTRAGVWAALRLVDFDDGRVLPHERTMRGPKADRLALMRATRAQLSPIFFIASDSGHRLGGWLEAAEGDPIGRAEFPAGEVHQVWRISDPGAHAEMAAAMTDEVLLIADGHHRYETALAYRDELIQAGAAPDGDGGHLFVLAYVVPENDPGLILRPTHRLLLDLPDVEWAEVLKRAERFFAMEPVPAGAFQEPERPLESQAGQPCFVLLADHGEDGWRLMLREPAAVRGLPGALTRLGSVAFHEVFLRECVGLTREREEADLRYTRDAGQAVAAVRTGDARAAALIAASSVADVRRAAGTGQRMPPKTTYFWPKVPTGVAMRSVDPSDG